MATSGLEPKPKYTPIDYEVQTFQKGLRFERPQITFDTTKWPLEAKAVLPSTAWDYVNGSAGAGQADENNTAEFRKWAFIPKRLTGQTHFPDMSVELFGERYPYPIVVGPVGVQRIFNPEGELAAAKAAAELDVPYTFSSASATSIEDVAAANGAGKRWFQLYWPGNEHNDITTSLLSRAQASGYSVLVVNVDTYIVGWRPHDMDEGMLALPRDEAFLLLSARLHTRGYSPFLRPDRVGVEMGFTDPIFRRQFKEQTGKEIEEDMGMASSAWAKIFTPGFPHSWDDLSFLRQQWKGPIVLKGIQNVEDASKCVAAGMDGIVVSNHGGREVDAGVASLSMLPEIVDAVGHRLCVMFDSGARTGTDVLKALALGARCVLLGRPWVYGLAIGGQAGVAHVLKSLLGEMQLSLHLMGLGSVRQDELNRQILRRTT